jgi:hypothetical protein
VRVYCTLLAVISFGTEHRVRNDGLRIPEKVQGIPRFLVFDSSHVLHKQLVWGVCAQILAPFYFRAIAASTVAQNRTEVLAPAPDADAHNYTTVAKPSSYPGDTTISKTGAPYRPPRAAKEIPVGATQHSMVIHPEAAGRVIGTGGVCLRYIRDTKGIYEVALDRVDPNFHVLRVAGTDDAVARVRKLVEFKVGVSTKQLNNKLRVHSWTLTPDGRMRTPREVHKTGDLRPSVHSTGVGRNFHAARMKGKKHDLEKERANNLRKRAPML